MPHFSVNDLKRANLDPEDQLRLVRHLGDKCPRCWAAVDDLPHRHPQAVVHPLKRALYRSQGRTSCFLGLSSQQLKAVRNVSSQPMSFAELVVEEAHETRKLRMVEWAGELAQKLLPTRLDRNACDLMARSELLLGKHLLAASNVVPEPAMLALASAELYRHKGKGSRNLRARILAEHAVIQWRNHLSPVGHTPELRAEMRRCLKEDLDLVGSTDPLLRPAV